MDLASLPLDPARLSRPTLLKIAALFCACVGLYDVVTIALFLAGGPVIGPARWTLFPDFLVFHAASRAFLEGHLATVYDFEAFIRFENAIYADRFPTYIGFRPFLYPPQWVLLILPLALVPVAVSYGLFMGATSAIATALAGWRDKWGWLAVITSPAALWTMVSGQNVFLSVGLFWGGFRLVDRSPVAAGVLLGLLTYKPQLWAVVPVALLAGRRWRALIATLVTAALMALASLALFGLELWRAFIEMTREASTPKMIDTMFLVVSDYMTTVLNGARVIGLPAGAAQVIHFAVAAFALAVVWRVARARSWAGPQMAVFAAATLLISPYLINYEMLLLMPAAVLLFRCRSASGFLPFEPLFYAALWLIPNLGVRFNQHHLPVTPVLILMLLGLAWLTATARNAEAP